MDTFGRKGMSDELLKFGFKLVIADEAHSFKNQSSQRSQALVSFLKNIERSELEQEWLFTCPFDGEKWNEKVTIKIDTMQADKRTFKTSHCPKCYSQVQQSAAAHVKVTRNCGVVMLTGTAIKNRADEYYVPLNLIAPEKFPSIESFRRKWLMQDSKGKWSRVAPRAMEAFKAEIAPFVLRREKEDVYKEVPKLQRIFTPIEITDERLKKAYNAVIDEIEIERAEKPNLTFFESIGHLQKLRRICGLSKVQFVADYAETFLMDRENTKLAIGYHHHSVRDALRDSLSALGTVKLDGQDDPQRKDWIAHKYFQTAPEQILLLGMMAAKEGLELPYIDTALVIEREWSSAEEEQFEFRFYNPDKDYLQAKGLNREKVTTVEYLLAVGTIDWFFYELVEEKRKIFGETVSNNWSIETDSSSWKELLDRTIGSRL
jgi:SNF2 family DNA or RNA helicase